jgi:uncharacterized protein (TIGR00106 family)
MFVAFAIYPTDLSHESEDITRIIEILEAAGLKYRVGPMGTVVEGEWDQVVAAIRRCHEVVASRHERVLTTVVIDEQRGGEHRLDDLVRSIEHHTWRHAAKGSKQHGTVERDF